MKNTIHQIKSGFHFAIDLFYLAGSILSHIFKKPFYYKLMIQNMYDFSYRTLFIVIGFAVSVGAVITLHVGLSLEKYGAKIYVSKVMILSLLSEVGPVIAVFILAGKIGAGITSEIASMKVTEQLDALKSLGISPMKRVIVPKVLACFFTIPILSLMVSFIALLVSSYVGKAYLQLDAIDFLARAINTPFLIFFLFGVFKTFVFSFLIAVISCHYGLNIQKGAYEIGLSTMKSIVMSFIFIIFGDLILTKIYYSFLHFGG